MQDILTSAVLSSTNSGSSSYYPRLSGQSCLVLRALRVAVGRSSAITCPRSAPGSSHVVATKGQMAAVATIGRFRGGSHVKRVMAVDCNLAAARKNDRGAGM